MKNIRKLLAILLLFSIFAVSLAACKSEEEEENVVATDISEYSIVRIEVADKLLKDVTAKLKKTILESTKAELKVGTDYVPRNETLDESGKEILLGDTNRTASIEALEELKAKGYDNGFIIKATDTKIAIVGLSDGDTIIGIKYFINNYVLKSEKDNTLPIQAGDTVVEKTGKLIYANSNMDLVVLETLTTIQDPNTKKSTQQYTYGKIIKLEHNGENNGMLLATNETVGWNDLRYPIYRSMDDGETWEQIARVNDGYNSNAIVGYQPYLFELPVDMGEFKEGTIFMSACSRIGREKTIMVLYYSTDLGKTWRAFCNVDVGGGYNKGGWSSDGLWEPILMYEEETGRVYCLYSDELLNGDDEETRKNGHNQRLVYKYTTDFKNWSAKYEMVACENPQLRPGMIALAKMGNGKYALAYEMCGEDCQIYIKFADSLDGWDPAEKGKLIKTLSGEGMGSAPAIAWTPNGGECGTLFVTAHHVVSGNSNTKCDLFISFDYGETFIDVDNPIPNKPNENIRSGYSPGFFVDKEGTVYYVNDPESSPGSLCEKFMFAKIKVY